MALDPLPDDPHGEEWRSGAEGGRANAKVLLAALAGRQFGRARVDQMRVLGIRKTRIRRWRNSGYLHLELPRVYAVGHPGRSTESDLCAAALYAGPGAMLDGATALWWMGLLKYPPKQISISTPRRVSSRANIVVHGRRNLDRTWHKGLPVTSVSQAIADFAATATEDMLRFVLANADYHDLLGVEALQALTGQGIRGSAALRQPLQIHLPGLARTRSRGERVLLTFCQAQGFPIPMVDIYIGGWLVDAVWPESKLVVEIDGEQGHRTPTQLQRDHQRDLELRAAGYVVLRYTERQLLEAPQAVAADIRRYH